MCGLCSAVHHEKMKQAHIDHASLLEFLQYLTDLPVLATLTRASVKMWRRIVKPGDNVLSMEALRKYV